MSRSSPSLQNPAKYFMSWSGSRGQLEHYDREKKENIPVKFPFEFLAIDHLSTITGYSEQDKSGFWSNEVKSISKEPLIVRTKSGIQAQGVYSDIKDTIKSKGAKYAQSVYIVHKVGGEWVLSNLQISGAALSPWIDLTNAHKVEDTGKVVLTDKHEDMKGTNKYFVPVFEYVNSTSEEDTIAMSTDKELQIYLSNYLATPPPEEISHDVDQSVGLASDDEQKSYVKPSRANSLDDDRAVDDYKQAVDKEFNINDSPINLDDIPF